MRPKLRLIVLYQRSWLLFSVLHASKPSAEPDVIAAFLRCGRRPITMDDGGIEKIGLMKAQYGTSENGIKTAIRLPSSKGAINARVVNFGTAYWGDSAK